MNSEYKLISGGRTPTGTVKHDVIVPGNIEEHYKYFDVRIGLTWPGSDNPAYACIVGEAWFDRNVYASDRGTMCLIWEAEYDGLSINRFLDKVTDAYTSYCVSEIYADLDQEDYKSAFYDYCDNHNLSGITLLQAPYADDFYLGLSQIKDLDSAGDISIPKTSEVFDEMRRIQRADLQNHPEINFPRLNALRYVIGGFMKSPPVAPLMTGPWMGGHSKQDWMSG